MIKILILNLHEHLCESHKMIMHNHLPTVLRLIDPFSNYGVSSYI